MSPSSHHTIKVEVIRGVIRRDVAVDTRDTADVAPVIAEVDVVATVVIDTTPPVVTERWYLMRAGDRVSHKLEDHLSNASIPRIPTLLNDSTIGMHVIHAGSMLQIGTIPKRATIVSLRIMRGTRMQMRRSTSIAVIITCARPASTRPSFLRWGRGNVSDREGRRNLHINLRI
jgi:hypothetical protein